MYAHGDFQQLSNSKTNYGLLYTAEIKNTQESDRIERIKPIDCIITFGCKYFEALHI